MNTFSINQFMSLLDLDGPLFYFILFYLLIINIAYAGDQTLEHVLSPF